MKIAAESSVDMTSSLSKIDVTCDVSTNQGRPSPRSLQERRGSYGSSAPLVDIRTDKKDTRKYSIFNKFIKKNKKVKLQQTDATASETEPDAMDFADGLSSVRGALFERDLDSLVENDSLPAAVIQMMQRLYTEGSTTEGIFRVSAGKGACKRLKFILDSRRTHNSDSSLVSEAEFSMPIVLDDSFSVVVVASVFQEMIRRLSDCLLGCHLYQDWMTSSTMDEMTWTNHVRNLVLRLSNGSQIMLRHLLCLLHHISTNSSSNKMTPYNLAVCWGQTLLWPPKDASFSSSCLELQMKDSPNLIKVVERLIAGTVMLFGEEVISTLEERLSVHEYAFPPSNLGKLRKTSQSDWTLNVQSELRTATTRGQSFENNVSDMSPQSDVDQLGFSYPPPLLLSSKLRSQRMINQDPSVRHVSMYEFSVLTDLSSSVPVAPPRKKKQSTIQGIRQNQFLSSPLDILDTIGGVSDLRDPCPRESSALLQVGQRNMQDDGLNSRTVIIPKIVIGQSNHAESVKPTSRDIEVQGVSLTIPDEQVLQTKSMTFSPEVAINSLPPPIPWRKGYVRSNEPVSVVQKRKLGTCQYDSALSSLESVEDVKPLSYVQCSDSEKIIEKNENEGDHQYTTSYESQGETDSAGSYCTPSFSSSSIARSAINEGILSPSETVHSLENTPLSDSLNYNDSKVCSRIDFVNARPASMLSFFEDQTDNKNYCRQRSSGDHSMLSRSDAFDEVVRTDDVVSYDVVSEMNPNDVIDEIAYRKKTKGIKLSKYTFSNITKNQSLEKCPGMTKTGADIFPLPMNTNLTTNLKLRINNFEETRIAKRHSLACIETSSMAECKHDHRKGFMPQSFGDYGLLIPPTVDVNSDSFESSADEMSIKVASKNDHRRFDNSAESDVSVSSLQLDVEPSTLPSNKMLEKVSGVFLNRAQPPNPLPTITLESKHQNLNLQDVCYTNQDNESLIDLNLNDVPVHDVLSNSDRRLSMKPLQLRRNAAENDNQNYLNQHLALKYGKIFNEKDNPHIPNIVAVCERRIGVVEFDPNRSAFASSQPSLNSRQMLSFDSSYDESSDTEDFDRLNTARQAARRGNVERQSIQNDERPKKRSKRVRKRYSDPSRVANWHIASSPKSCSVERSKSDMTAFTHRRSRRKKLYVMNDMNEVVIKNDDDDSTSDIEMLSISLNNQTIDAKIVNLVENDIINVSADKKMKNQSTPTQRKCRPAAQLVTVKERPWHKELVDEYCSVSQQCLLDNQHPSGERQEPMSRSKFGISLDPHSVHKNADAVARHKEQNLRRYPMLDTRYVQGDLSSVKLPLPNNATFPMHQNSIVKSSTELPAKRSVHKECQSSETFNEQLEAESKSINTAASRPVNNTNSQDLTSKNELPPLHAKTLKSEKSPADCSSNSKLLVNVQEEQAIVKQITGPSVPSKSNSNNTSVGFSHNKDDIVFRANWLKKEMVNYPSGAGSDVQRRSSLKQDVLDTHVTVQKLPNDSIEKNTTNIKLYDTSPELTQHDVTAKGISNSQNVPLQNVMETSSNAVRVDSTERQNFVIRDVAATRRQSLHISNTSKSSEANIERLKSDNSSLTKVFTSVMGSKALSGRASVSKEAIVRKPVTERVNRLNISSPNSIGDSTHAILERRIESQACPVLMSTALNSAASPKIERRLSDKSNQNKSEASASNREFKSFSLDRKSSLQNISFGRQNLLSQQRINTTLHPTVEEISSVTENSSTKPPKMPLTVADQSLISQTRTGQSQTGQTVSGKTMAVDGALNNASIMEVPDFSWSVAKMRNNFTKPK